MTYSKPPELNTILTTYNYGDPEDLFYVYDCFNCIIRCLDEVDFKTNSFRKLAGASLQLFGWTHLPLTKELLRDDGTYDELVISLPLNPYGEEVVFLKKYWAIRRELLKLPLSWEDPCLIMGDPLYALQERMNDWDKYPRFKEEAHGKLARQIHSHAGAGLEIILNIDDVIISVYGQPKCPTITVQELIAHEPSLEEDFFSPYEMM